jgi:NAD(P)-dependent dehydrogenase (short-subunit alcohol dehydrogenase family)
MKTMIVTGASSGVGRGLAIHFAGQGWHVAAVARNAERLAEVQAACPENIATYVCDISQSAEVRSTFDAILAACPAPDVLVNNAGLVTKGSMEDDDLSVIDQGIDINLKGTMYCTGAVVPAMKRAGAGLIVNVASIAGLPGGIHDRWTGAEQTQYCTYGVSKAGMIHFSESVAKQLRPHGIRVTCLCPGGIETPLWTRQGGYPDAEAKLITVEDMNNLVQFLVDQPENVLYKCMTLFPMNEWK